MSRRNRKQKKHLSRRQILGYGLGAAAAAHLIAPVGRPLFGGASAFAEEDAAPVVPNGGKAKQVVYLFMNGGASHIETFDPKPGTTEGGPTRTIATATKGVHIASSLPQLAKRMGDICLLRGMTTKEGNHERARYLMHTGYAPNPTVTHPSIGSLLAHEVGSLDAALPRYIAVNGPGARAGFLGVNYEPFTLRVNAPRTDARNQGNQRRNRRGGQSRAVVENLESPRGVSKERRDQRLGFLSKLNDGFSKDRDGSARKAQAAMFERARRLMDTPQNTSFDYTQESAETKARYGETQFGMGCLLARRLIDEGVTCVEVNMGGWDTHDDGFNRVTALNADLDRGASALLDDLKASGKLDETLVVWVGDFGRTPRIAATGGRGHYPRAWSAWMAGGGVQGGRVLGKTDKTGAAVIEHPINETDFMASIAHATGMEKDKVFYSNGRPISLVYETGKVVADLFKA